jgi:hypothetical protein
VPIWQQPCASRETPSGSTKRSSQSTRAALFVFHRELKRAR